MDFAIWINLSSNEKYTKRLKIIRQDGLTAVGISGTYTSASKAAELMDIPVNVLDSRSNSMSLGWQVLAAARVREKGGDLAAMIAAADAARSSMVLLISLDTLFLVF